MRNRQLLSGNNSVSLSENRKAGKGVKIPALSLQTPQRQGRGTPIFILDSVSKSGPKREGAPSLSLRFLEGQGGDFDFERKIQRGV